MDKCHEVWKWRPLLSRQIVMKDRQEILCYRGNNFHPWTVGLVSLPAVHQGLENTLVWKGPCSKFSTRFLSRKLQTDVNASFSLSWLNVVKWVKLPCCCLLFSDWLMSSDLTTSLTSHWLIQIEAGHYWSDNKVQNWNGDFVMRFRSEKLEVGG